MTCGLPEQRNCFVLLSFAFFLGPFGCVMIRLNFRWGTAVCEKDELHSHQAHLLSYSILAWLEDLFNCTVDNPQSTAEFSSESFPHNLNICPGLSPWHSRHQWTFINTSHRPFTLSSLPLIGENVKHKRQYHLSV